jgi:hypothetical protein
MGAMGTDRLLQRDRGQDPVGASATDVSFWLSRDQMRPIGVQHTPVIGLIAMVRSARCCYGVEVLLELVLVGGVVLCRGMVEARRNGPF